MFERYTEKARRVIFFARYEASQFGAPYIETEHLLLGILREDKSLTNRFLRSHAAVESIRKQIEHRTTVREKISTAVDLPLSNESKRVLEHAKTEADVLSHKNIGTEHLLFGILREEECFAAELLRERGLKLAAVREDLAREQHDAPTRQQSPEAAMLGKFSRDLTQAAMENKLDPVVGRDEEVEWVIEVLCSRNNRNPILLGERGAGKTAIIEGLSQRIADGKVPHFLVDKRILAFDGQILAGWMRDGQKAEERFNAIGKALVAAPDVIVFFDELQTLVGKGSTSGSVDTSGTLKLALLGGEIQCISACTPEEYRAAIHAAPWLERCSRTVNVLPLNKEQTLLVIRSRKEQYEKFHAVSYTDSALTYAADYSSLYFPDSPLLAKATEILDSAGSRVKSRQTPLPEEVVEILKRIKLISHRMENAIANHEFERARFYSDEERTERNSLRALREKYKLDESAVGVVTRDDIEDVLSRWMGVPVSIIREKHSIGRIEVSPAASPPPTSQKSPLLRAFLCHSSKDKSVVRNLYKRLKENQIDPWLDEEKLLAGQDWDYEIGNAVRSSDVVIVCLSADSVGKAGYLQKEMKKVLDVAEEQPEGTIYLIPVKLEECEVPTRLRRWHWVNLFEVNGFERLMDALLERARSVGPAPG
jgi:ATP-dependent Clp protease ATP-binding subunit ClpC